MPKQETILKAIIRQGVLPLYFHPDAAVSIQVMRSLYEAGIRVIEYTNRGKAALDNLEKLKAAARKDCRGMLLGMGTVTDGKTAERALQAGADFLISPGFAKDVLAVAAGSGRLWIPGCMTPTELIRASRAGIRLVKLFPGNLLGPDFVLSVKALFPDLLFMPTGGVEPQEENLRSWFNAGVSAVGIGSRLITPSLIESKAFSELTAQTAGLIKQINTIRQA
jgi:2-dehydro-3-deoxyphosphogluconate aldolase/(4S)-4-hydroxy-2-oxoglutarate aldolase